MIKQQTLKNLLQEYDIRTAQLEKDNVYLFDINVGDMPPDQVNKMCINIKTMLDKAGIQAVIFPRHHNIGLQSVCKLKKAKHSKKQGDKQ